MAAEIQFKAENTRLNPNSIHAFGQILPLLLDKTDTKRFVGLSLLKSLLDTKEDARNNEKLVAGAWKSLQTKYLAKLLRQKHTEKTSVEDALCYNQLAISVIHTFIKLAGPGPTFRAELVKPLILTLDRIEAPSRMLVFQILQSFASFTPQLLEIFEEEELRDFLIDDAIARDEDYRELIEFLRLLITETELSGVQQDIWGQLVKALLERKKESPERIFELLAGTIEDDKVRDLA